MRSVWMFMAAAVLSGTAAAAEIPGGLSLSPVRVDLSASRRAEAVAVSNTGSQPRTVEIDVMHWSQADGEDVYEPATELRANPARFVIAPGASQTVRVGLIRQAQAPQAIEGAYRVYFREVPQADTDAGSALKFALRIGVPVFVKPQQTAQPQLQWTAQLAGDALKLKAVNHGALHARVADVKVRSDSGEVAADGFRYVLPGAWREWAVPHQTAKPRTVVALLENGRSEFPIEAAR